MPFRHRLSSLRSRRRQGQQRVPGRFTAALGWAAVAVGLSSCDLADLVPQPDPDAPEPVEVKLSAAASNYPLAYLTETIGGGMVKVWFVVPNNVDPQFWQPSDEAIERMQQADLIVLNGASYEKWRRQVTLPEARVIDTSAAFADELIEIPDAVTHSHGPHGTHTHAGTATITWLDFNQARLQADAILADLVERLPADDFMLRRPHAEVSRELESLDELMLALGQQLDGTPVLASHPVYHYLARRYHLNLRSVDWEPDEAPDEEQWAQLDGLLERHPAKVMLWERQPLVETFNALARRGVAVVVFNPVSNRPEHGDFLSIMRQNVAHFDLWWRLHGRAERDSGGRDDNAADQPGTEPRPPDQGL